MTFSQFRVGCALVAIAIPVVVWAASPATTSKEEAPTKTVDLFAAMEAGEVEAVLYFKDSTEGMMTVKNNTGKPLTIKLPDAFAGVPILAQRGRGGGGGAAGGMGGRGG